MPEPHTAPPPRQPALYIPHGGGPCFFMDPMPGMPPDLWDRMAAYLRGIPASLPAVPRAIVVVSAHWEAPRPTIGVAPSHTLLFDYYGFPEHTYRLRYPARGAPALGARMQTLLAQAGVEADTDDRRGLDHGVFVPFKLMVPDADLPIVPLSLQRSLDAGFHFSVGAALAPLRDEGVLIVASGMSYHNLRDFFQPGRGDDTAQAFDDWLARTIADPDPQARNRALLDWAHAPGARASHPRPEHWIPILVAAGAGAADPASRPYVDRLLNKPVCAVRFG